jgi:dTMP kinase
VKFIAIEGIDGAGKTTLASSIKEKLPNLKVVVTAEPFDRTFSSLISKHGWDDPILLTLLFATDRAIHLKWMRSQEADLVITDRYFFSSIAYQSALGIDQEWIEKVNSKFPFPDLTILLDIDPSVALSRLSEDSYSFPQKLRSLPEVRRRYLDMAKRYNFLVIDGSKSKEWVLSQVLPHVINLVGMPQGGSLRP